MFKSLVAAAAAGLLVSPAAGFANTPANGATESSQPAKEQAKEMKICRRDESSMGTRMSPRICKTESEWKAEAERSRRDFEERDKD